MTRPEQTYTVARSTLPWHEPEAAHHATSTVECGYAHRTIETASRCLDRIRARWRAAHGPGAFPDVRIVARDLDYTIRESYRPLTPAEHDELRDAQDDAPWKTL